MNIIPTAEEMDHVFFELLPVEGKRNLSILRFKTLPVPEGQEMTDEDWVKFERDAKGREHEQMP